MFWRQHSNSFVTILFCTFSTFTACSTTPVEPQPVSQSKSELEAQSLQGLPPQPESVVSPPSVATQSENDLVNALVLRKKYLRKPIEASLKAYRKAKSETEKYAAAKHLFMLTLDEGPAFTAKLSTSNSDFAKANQYFEAVQALVRKFELSHSGTSLTSLERPNCGPVQFQAFAKQMGVKELALLWPQLITLPSLYLEENGIRLSKTLLDMAEKTGSPDLVSLRLHYQSFYEVSAKADLRSRIEQDEGVVMKRRNITQAEVRPLIMKYLTLSPACLVAMNTGFLNESRKLITIERGKYYLKQLQTYFASHREVPATLEEFASNQPNDPVNASYLDEYGNPYLFSVVGRKGIFKSAGPDSLPNTDDDVIIGEF